MNAKALTYALAASAMVFGGIYPAQGADQYPSAPSSSLPPEVQSRLKGVTLTPVPGAKPVEGLDIPMPKPPVTPPNASGAAPTTMATPKP
jgi:hypothetical protein